MTSSVPGRFTALAQENPPATRSRGRPKGARSAVVRDVRTLGVHHFAFLRATLLGLDVRQAFDRYLAFGESTSDLRHIEARRRDLIAQLVEAGQRLDATLAEDAKITRFVDLLREGGPAAKVAALPSLDAWVAAEGMDPDEWSEAELLEEYRLAHGLDSVVAQHPPADAGPPSVQARIQALNHLSGLLGVAPQASDAVDAWFARPVVRRLREAGIATLEQLSKLINAQGFRWHRHVPKIGARRATQIVAWLESQADALKLILRDDLGEPAAARRLRLALSMATPGEAPRFGIVPLERLALPAALQGANGIFRSRTPNSLDAVDDLDAVRRWLKRHDDQPATQRSYRKEIERFVLWSTGVRRKPVSSIDASDCQAYRAFLQAVPTTWVNPVAVPRTDPRWRPFRGTPIASSQKQALVIVQAMFEGLNDAGYLVANPMRAAMKGIARPSATESVTTPPASAPARSFGELEWAHLQRCVDDEPATPARLRLRCLLELLLASGIRLEELARARFGDLRRVDSPAEPPAWVIAVTARDGKARDLPIPEGVVALLRQHAQDAAAFAGHTPLEARPLVSALNGSVAQWGVKNQRLVLERRVATGGGALSVDGIHIVLKRFLARAAISAQESGLDPRRFKAASAQWMRHTFVRNALAEGTPIELVSAIAGHGRLDTTAIHANRTISKIRAPRDEPGVSLQEDQPK